MDAEYGIQIGFAQWVALGVPIAALLLVLSWLLLTRVAFRFDHKPVSGVTEMIFESLTELGAMSRAERRVAALFLAVAVLWVMRPVLNSLFPGVQLTDTIIAMAGGLALFLIPVNLRKGSFLLDWQSASTIPWGVLVLFGGGLSLASAMQTSGLSAWIGNGLTAYGALPLIALILLVIALVVFLTEITSNTATASLFIPIAATLGAGISGDPMLLAVPVALAASCAFMLPVATPPNAIIYSSGWVPTPQMAGAGLIMNVLCIFILTAAVYATAGWLLGQASAQ
jgi:sodium-dependent dicarboxylate transporter 2/3/5